MIYAVVFGAAFTAYFGFIIISMIYNQAKSKSFSN